MDNTSGGDLFLRHGESVTLPTVTEGRSTPATFEGIEKVLTDATAAFDPDRRLDVDHLSAVLMHWDGDDHAEERCALLARTCFYYQRIGCSFDGIPRGKAARDLAHARGLKNPERRACNVLGGAYLDSANFEEACKVLERALLLARELGDP